MHYSLNRPHAVLCRANPRRNAGLQKQSDDCHAWHQPSMVIWTMAIGVPTRSTRRAYFTCGTAKNWIGFRLHREQAISKEAATLPIQDRLRLATRFGIYEPSPFIRPRWSQRCHLARGLVAGCLSMQAGQSAVTLELTPPSALLAAKIELSSLDGLASDCSCGGVQRWGSLDRSERPDSSRIKIHLSYRLGEAVLHTFLHLPTGSSRELHAVLRR